jgi:hypothetical protein
MSEENGNEVQEVLSQIQQQKQKKWSESCKNLLDKISAMEPKDRLDYATAVIDIIQAISFSMQGWIQWYKVQFFQAFNKKPLSDMSEDDWKSVFEFFKEAGMQILGFDMNFTKSIEDRQDKEKLEKEGKLKKRKSEKKETYVA